MAVIGKFERLDGGFAVGWAYDTAVDRPLALEVFADGIKISEGVTGGLRPELVAAGGPIAAGFEIPLPTPALKSATSIEVRADTVSIGERRLAVPSRISDMFSGIVDTYTNGSVTGWAVNIEQPNLPVALTILLGSRPIASCLTTIPRPDIQSQFGGRAPVGFQYSAPAFMRAGLPVLLRFFVANTSIELGGSPLLINGSPNSDKAAFLEFGR